MLDLNGKRAHWAFYLGMLILTGIIRLAFCYGAKWIGPRIVDFPCNDSSINQPYKSSTFPSKPLNAGLYLYLIIVIVITEYFAVQSIVRKQHYASAIAKFRNQLFGIRCLKAFVISQIGASAVFCLLRVAKYSVGRLRPNFVLTCIPNTSSITCVLGYAHQYDCTNEHKSWVIESRLSFFSGHAAHTFYILMFVTFYLNIRIHKKSYLRYMISFLYIIMISFATVVASSRVSDNKHHPSDVLMGVLVGVSFAFCTVTFFVDDFESECNFIADIKENNSCSETTKSSNLNSIDPVA